MNTPTPPSHFSGNIYGATFFMATGFHGFHVLVGTVFLLVCLIRAYAGHFTPTQHLGFEFAAWYWHFVDVVWLFLFICIYVWFRGAGARGRALMRGLTCYKGAVGRPPLFFFASPLCGEGALAKRADEGSVADPHPSRMRFAHRIHPLPQGRGKDMSMTPDQPPTVTQSALRGIACRCPRCGKGKLYAGFLNLRPNCEACGLDYAFIDAGDGPAIFIIMLAGAIVVTAALIVEIKYQPPFWLHAALWLPLILATTLLPLRSMKSLLIALQFHHKAAPGRLIDREPK